MFQVALVGPAPGGEFVGVARCARGGELVDVGEGQLGELGDLGGGQTCGYGTGCQASPGHAGADAVGAEQGVHRSAVAHLATPQLVGCVTAVAACGVPAREVQVVPQGGADGSADGGAHVAREGVGVGRDLVDDRLDDLVGGGLQRGPEYGDRRLIESQFTGPPDHMAHFLFPANNSADRIYVVRSGLYALRHSKLEP